MNGFIRTLKNGETIGEISGAGADLSFAGLNLKFSLSVRDKMNNDNAPDFDIFSKAGHGGVVKVGAAWEKRNDQGEVFLQLTFEDGSLPKKIYANFYGNPEGEGFVYGPRKKLQQAA